MSFSLANISSALTNHSAVIHPMIDPSRLFQEGIPPDSLNPMLNSANFSILNITNNVTNNFDTNFNNVTDSFDTNFNVANVSTTNFTQKSELSNSKQPLQFGSRLTTNTPRVTSANRTQASNSTFMRSLKNNLSRITSGFAKTFSHSFSMNDPRVDEPPTPNDVLQNSHQKFMGSDKGKLQQVHSVPFPNGFPMSTRGPIATKLGPKDNERVAVSPKFSISNRNSSVAHLPVLWTALSLALGVEVRGELIRGLPCITRFNQLFCRSGGTSYPSEKIERFIDDNKALMRRMHGEFISLSTFTDNLRPGRRRRSQEEFTVPTPEFFDVDTNLNFNETDGSFAPPPVRTKRQAARSRSPGPLPKSDRVDSCHSEEEVATPYWASNSRGKILAIVNTKEFSQIIHQEICTKTSTKRCTGDCGCEQKYKYHRLLAYDPDNDCKGIFMDWFLFPSCCSCRCDPL